jgi:hypothetical protein
MKPLLSEGHQKQLDVVLGKCTNVLSALYPHVYFPTYSNSLKDIGRLVGTDCSTHEATGLHSIIWRAEWEAQHELDLKAKLVGASRLAYNFKSASVTAPSEALVTVWAYLASTPRG